MARAIRYPCSLQQTFLVDVAVVNGNVSCYAFREDDTVLHDNAALTPPPFLVERVDVRATNIDLTLQDGIESEHKLDECRLSAARGTNDGRHFPIGDAYRHVVQGLAQGVRVILSLARIGTRTARLMTPRKAAKDSKLPTA